MSRIEGAFIVAATALAVFAPTAHADQDSDFLGCLSNQGITWNDKDAMLQVFHKAQQVVSEGQVLYLTLHGLDQITAQKVAQCVEASPGSKTTTAHAHRGTECSADRDMDCRPDPPGYLDQVHTAGIAGNSDQTLLTVGQRICDDLAHGTPSALVAAGLRQTSPSLSLHQGNVAVDAALMNLCPQLMRADNQEPVFLPLE